MMYYQVEWWTTASQPEIQVVEMKWTAVPTTLTFSLAFQGSQSLAIPMDASAANMRNALMTIGATTNTPMAFPIGAVQVTRTAINVNQGYQWTVTFVSAVRNQPLLQMNLVTNTGGAGVQGRVFEAVAGVAGGTSTFPGTPEVQVITLVNAAAPITGFFRLAFMGSTWSTYIPATGTAASLAPFLQTVLQELSTVGQVTVTPATSANFQPNTLAWAVTFLSVVGNVPGLAIDATKLIPATTVATIYDGNNAVQPNSGAWCSGADPACPDIYTYVRIGEQAIGYGFYATNVPTVLTYTATGLTAGKTYYASVTAKNALGLGPRAAASPVSVIPPLQVPSQPTSVAVNVNTGQSTSLLASWAAPVSNGGNSILKYTVEYDT
ncbi:hypothetical protein As57867_019543, partial [Aphanomyces stellatus]